ncbi:DMT family transporter [Parabacteroides chinchillae]|uniref:Permease of the drug/metabolite transporter (DMT) superfamily n=1 Tax=Parabacteroides chinchillae TaxID=871327 RepID=A0A8G2BXL2_9BACT|nr:DMT family transporter [Parabacteroides chinchillae]SEG07196.1 Permease of the drug/metabolite transporter (DMT) superfamily [Parabacteroides chinchillae]
MGEVRGMWFYHLIAIVTVIVWGTTFVSTKILLSYGLSPMEILLYRFALAYVAMWFVAPRKILARNYKDELLFVMAGLCGGSLYFVSENTALGITLASNVSLILCTAPILTAFLTFLFTKGEKLDRKLIWGSLIAFVGVALVVFNGSFILKINPVGDVLTLIAALMWAFYGLILKRMGARYPVLFITRKVFFYGIITLFPMFLFRPIQTDWHVLVKPVVGLNLLFLGLVASMLCYIMWNTAVKQLGVVRTTNYIYIVPLVTLITSAIVIDEIITIVGLFGSVFILSGVYVAERGLKCFRLLRS